MLVLIFRGIEIFLQGPSSETRRIIIVVLALITIVKSMDYKRKVFCIPTLFLFKA
jgi:hypothetical protein